MNKIRYVYRITLLFLFIAFLLSCEENASWNLESSDSFLVVDAIITNEYKQQEIFIYKSSGELNETPVPVNDAEIWLWDENRLYAFQFSETDGLYRSEEFAATISNKYVLLINYQGNSDTAYAIMEPITPFKNDTVYYNDGLYRFVYGGSDMPAMTEVYYDWSSNQEYCNLYGSCNAKSTHYTLNNIDVADEFGPAKQIIWFPKNTTLIRKKYSLSANHQKFIRSLLIETEWRGGLFDTEQGNVPTNFINGTRGWFGVCMVISDTILVK